MTDKEIMKALECCSERGLLSESCDECPNLAMGSLCMDQMLRDTLDLIKRQKAEFENLEKEYDRVFKENVRNQTEVERLEKLLDAECDTCACGLLEQRVKARVEAIKEFAEKLKAKKAIHYCKHCGKEIDYTDVFNDSVDTILKEMVGEE